MSLGKLYFHSSLPLDPTLSLGLHSQGLVLCPRAPLPPYHLPSLLSAICLQRLLLVCSTKPQLFWRDIEVLSNAQRTLLSSSRQPDKQDTDMVTSALWNLTILLTFLFWYSQQSHSFPESSSSFLDQFSSHLHEDCNNSRSFIFGL